MVPSALLLDRIRERYPSLKRASDELNDTAQTWKIPGHNGTIGFISSMSDHFCGSCNRLRLTADGQIKVWSLFRNMTNLLIYPDFRSVSSTLRKYLYATSYEEVLLMKNYLH